MLIVVTLLMQHKSETEKIIEKTHTIFVLIILRMRRLARAFTDKVKQRLQLKLRPLTILDM